jgi:isopentenyl-diphosphate Delta-isomerase
MRHLSGSRTGPAGSGGYLPPPCIEEVVLCADDGSAIGTAPKSTVHTTETPLHLAFSCYLFDDAGRVLVTRRAGSKRTWPGARTNSCYGHPSPGESICSAVSRRLADEVGITANAIKLVLPTFRYRAIMPNGALENEFCPVYAAHIDQPVQRAPDRAR